MRLSPVLDDVLAGRGWRARVHVPAPIEVVVDFRRRTDHPPEQEDGEGGGFQAAVGGILPGLMILPTAPPATAPR